MEGVVYRQYLIRIQIINWIINLFRSSPELCTYEGLMDELNEWMLSDTCARDGCDNLLWGYKSNAFYCADRCRYYVRDRKPKKMAYRKKYENTPERKAYMMKYGKKRNQTPERKAYMKAYWKKYHARKKAEAKPEAPA